MEYFNLLQELFESENINQRDLSLELDSLNYGVSAFKQIWKRSNTNDIEGSCNHNYCLRTWKITDWKRTEMQNNSPVGKSCLTWSSARSQ
jgi:D-mannonate dehydratase